MESKVHVKNIGGSDDLNRSHTKTFIDMKKETKTFIDMKIKTND